MKPLFRLLTSVVILGLCTPATASEYVLMKVSGNDVSSAEAQRFWEGLFPAGQAPALENVKPEVRDKVLRGVMAEQVLAAEAKRTGIDSSEAVQRQIDDVKRKIVIRALLNNRTNESITEDDLKKEYEKLQASLKDVREVRARHILTASEAEAKDARKKIESGKGFEEVARSMSKDAGSAQNGGDLGYFTKDKMVKAFADAAFAMKKGEISAPVKSSFGWHIIKLEDSRAVQAPSYGDVREMLRAQLQEKKLNEYVSSLIKAADIKVYDAQGNVVAFDKTIPLQAITSSAISSDAKGEQKEVRSEAKAKKTAPKTDQKSVEKTEPPKAQQNSKTEPAKPEAQKQEPVKTEPAKVEAPKPEHSVPDMPNVEGAH